jgi:hypothetical protein
LTDYLGFESAFDEMNGEIYVKSIIDDDLAGRFSFGDTAIAVSGAPLGVVKHPSVFIERVNP